MKDVQQNVLVDGLRIERVTGSATKNAGDLVCSRGSFGCRNITMQDIEIAAPAGFSCANAEGTAVNVTPSACLRMSTLKTDDSENEDEAAAISGMRSGAFVPLQADAGPLVCPQSLTTLQGIGHCIGVKPLGAAYVDASAGGADLFVYCSAQESAPQGSRVLYRYPFVTRAPGGVPVFGAPVVLEDWSPKFPLLYPKTVWQIDRHGPVYGAAFSGDYMHLLVLRNGPSSRLAFPPISYQDHHIVS